LVAGPRWAPDAKTDWPTHVGRNVTLTLDNVQNCDRYIDILSSQTYRSYSTVEFRECGKCGSSVLALHNDSSRNDKDKALQKRNLLMIPASLQ
jgi:hypothetical protein